MHHGLSQMKVSCLLEDSRGYIWVGTRNGLNRFDGERFEVFSSEDGLPNNRILGLLEHDLGELVILTSEGISFFDGVRFLNYEHNFPEVDYQFYKDADDGFYVCGIQSFSFQSDIGFHKIPLRSAFGTYCEESNQFMFVSTDSLIAYQGGKIQSPKTKKQPIMFLNNETIMEQKTLVHQQTDKGVYVYNCDELAWNKLTEFSTDPNSNSTQARIHKNTLYSTLGNYDLPFKNPNCLIQARNGDYYIGTEEGLVRYFESSFYQVPTTAVPYAWSMIDDDEYMYFGNYGQGLVRQHKKNKTYESVVTRYPHFHCGASKNQEGRLFFSNNYGLGNLEDETFRLLNNHSTLYSVYDPLRSQHVLGIHNGIVIRKENGNERIVKEPEAMHECHYIQYIGIGPQNNYFCGSYFGLTHYNPDTEVSTHYTDKLGNLPIGPGVFSGHQDNAGRFWLGGSSGLCYVDHELNKLIKIDAPELETQIKSIIEIESGILLLGTKNELLTFDTKSYFDDSICQINFYNRTTGYDGIEPGYTGFYQDLEKNIWVTAASHTSYLPAQYQLKENFDLRPIIKSIGTQSIRFNSELDTVATNTGNNIVVSVSAIGAERPTIAAYALQINDGPWSPWQESDQFIINLDHGEHKINVATGPRKSIDRNIHSAMISVALPIYQRGFFMPTLVVLFLCLLAFTLFSWWRRRKERQQYLIQLEESRYLRSQLLLSELNPHFIFNVLASIQNKILKGDKHEANSKLVQLSGLIRNFLNVSYKSNDPSNRLEHEITLSKEVELLKSYLEFEKQNSNDHFNFTIQLNDGCEPTQIMIPPMLIQPFVENAVKHGVLPNDKLGQIDVIFTYTNNILTCEITDNGRGIDHMKAQKRPGESRPSLGSTIVNDRIHVLNQLGYQIELDIKQQDQGGTKVVLTVHE